MYTVCSVLSVEIYRVNTLENYWSTMVNGASNSAHLFNIYLIRSNYHTYLYKLTVKQFSSLQITASVLFVFFFIKAYVVGTHLNCIDKSMQFKWVTTTYVLIKKIRKKSDKHHPIRPLLIFVFKGVLSRQSHILLQVFPVILKNLSAQYGN